MDVPLTNLELELYIENKQKKTNKQAHSKKKYCGKQGHPAIATKTIQRSKKKGEANLEKNDKKPLKAKQSILPS